jgi:hypothetical protein
LFLSHVLFVGYCMITACNSYLSVISVYIAPYSCCNCLHLSCS